MATTTETTAVVDRRVSSVAPPPWFPLTDEELYPDKLPDTKRLHEFLAQGGKLSSHHVKQLVNDATEIMKLEPNLLYLSAPIVVVGDLHGQYYDLHQLFLREWSTPYDATPEQRRKSPKWLFLGDYVDRGSFGLEIVLLLFAYKIRFPENLYLIRGNHESRTVTAKFNFKEECVSKYSIAVYDAIMNAFDALPLAAVLSTSERSYFAVHGGLSRDLTIVEDINSIERFVEPGKSGLLCDLLWSDPLGEDTAQGLDENTMKEWIDVDFCDNPTRGVGLVFGYKAINYFLNDNGLSGIIRSHEVAQTGVIENYMCQKKEDRPFPLVLTVFSAPNYCGWYNNQAAIFVLNEDGTHLYKYFEETKAPYTLPAHLNGFTYTLPWITDQVSTFMSIFFGMLIDQIESNEVADQLRSKLEKVKDVHKKMEQVEKRNNAAVQLKGLFVDSIDEEQVNQITTGRLSIKDLDNQLERSPLASPAPATPRGVVPPHPSKTFWSKHPLQIDPQVIEAYNDILDNSNPTNWAIMYYYEPYGVGNSVLSLKSKGEKGVDEIAEELRDDERSWIYYRKMVGDGITVRYQFVLVSWLPEKISVKKKAEMSTHKGVIKESLEKVTVEVHVTDLKELREKLC